jgi:acetyl-CoA carboxylase carboxyltransferase component
LDPNIRFSIHRSRIELLLDENSFEELYKLVTHRCRDFGMEEQNVPGDGFVTGYGPHRGPPGLRLQLSPD